MSGTALDHQLVRDYLRELDTALRGLPAAQAAELREQITAHLDEALSAGASDQKVAAGLDRLGTPASLAAEAAAGAPAAAAAAAGAPPSVGAVVVARLYRVRPVSWLAAGLAVALIAVAGCYAHKFLTTYPVQYNQAAQIAASRSYTDIANGGFAGLRETRHISFGLSVAIPPAQTRLVRVTWISKVCLTRGESEGTDQIYLRVRSGWFTRTEIVPQQGWYLIGPSHPACH